VEFVRKIRHLVSCWVEESLGGRRDPVASRTLQSVIRPLVTSRVPTTRVLLATILFEIISNYLKSLKAMP
jgi:hypothetical protein